MFKSELEMSQYFFDYVSKSKNMFLTECKGLFGIPDYVLIDKEKEKYNIISIELKIKNWKKALQQAYKYKNFSNMSFVVLDEKYTHVALQNIELFRLANIGLASFNLKSEFKIYHQPEHDMPFCEVTLQKLVNQISEKQTKKNTKAISFVEFLAA